MSASISLMNQYGLAIYWLSLLSLAGPALSNVVTQLPCYQGLPVQLRAGDFGKVIVPFHACSKVVVHQEDLIHEPEVEVEGLVPTGRYCFFLLKENTFKRNSFTILWSRAYITPLGQSLTANKTFSTVWQGYSAPNFTGNYTFLVYRHILTYGFNHFPMERKIDFDPVDWQLNFRDSREDLLANTTFSMFASHNMNHYHHQPPPPPPHSFQPLPPAGVPQQGYPPQHYPDSIPPQHQGYPPQHQGYPPSGIKHTSAAASVISYSSQYIVILCLLCLISTFVV